MLGPAKSSDGSLCFITHRGMFAFVRHSVNKCVSEKLLTESKDISMSAPQHPISVSAASALFCQLCLHLRNSVQK